MAPLLIRRAFGLIPVLLGVSVIVFLLLRLIPGDPASAMLGEMATEQDVRDLQHRLRLDEPLFSQYIRWLLAILQGDFGDSIQWREPVLPLLLRHFGNSLLLAVVGTIIGTVLGVSAGVFASVRHRTLLDRITTMAVVLAHSVPSFWLALVFILVFAVEMGMFPTGGMRDPTGSDSIDVLHHLALPAITIGLLAAGAVARVTRTAMLDVLRQDYVRTARGKGIAESAITFRHAFRNAVIPVITVVGLQFGHLLGTAVAVETVFAWPGLGKVMFESLGNRDYPVIQGALLVIAASFVLVNLAVDVFATYLNPPAKLIR